MGLVHVSELVRRWKLDIGCPCFIWRLREGRYTLDELNAFVWWARGRWS